MSKAREQTSQFKKLMLLCDEIFGTDEAAREDRLELAEYLLRRDVTTFNDLDPAQVCRMLDACEGYQLIEHLKSLRPPTVET